MDGAALLDSLSEWTQESHPNVSPEKRRHTNELFSELKTELLTLLGTSSQVGGSNNTNEGGSNITVFQPMDEKVLAGLSADEINSRLALVESNINTGDVQTGGDVDVLEPLGMLKRFKLFTGLRKFNNFVDDFEKLRAEINKNMSGYEAEAARVKGIIDGIVSSTKQYFLYGKLKTMMQIMRGNETGMIIQKTNVLTQRIERVDTEMTRMEVELEKYRKTAEKIFFLPSGFWKWKTYDKETKYFWKFKQRGFVAKLEHEVEEQEKEYLKLDKEMNYYMSEITNAKQLKILEAAAGGKEVSGLTKTQRQELADYQKNREKYEKMLSFDEVRRNEQETFLARKENLLITLAYYKHTLASSQYMGNEKGEMGTQLAKWNTAITNLYADLNTSIKKSEEYKKDIKDLVEFIADNGNNVSKLIGGMDEFEEIKAEYDKYLEQAKKAYETQELTHDTLISIKNKFIELIPDASLLPDMFRVVRAQSFVLSIINNVLAGKQLELGGNFEEGTKYFEDKIKQMKGGAGQSGGVFLQSLIPIAHIPAHGAAFYEHDHNNPAQVWNTNPAYVALDYLSPTAAGQNINILTLPYGVRRITQDYVDRMNTAMSDLDKDKIVYIPILDIRKISNSQMEIIILIATHIADTAVLRITSQKRMRLNQNGRQYQQIQGNYYLYNILEDHRVANGRSNLKRLLEDRRFIKISGTHIILPVFYRFNDVDNQLFNYFEYALLHPFIGGIMSATLRDSDLRRTVVGDVGVNAAQAGYDFKDKNNALVAGNPYELNLRLKLHNDDIDLTNITANNYIYYYNFCGTEIIIKQYTAGDFFNVQNYSAMAAPGGHALYTNGNLQPTAGLIDMNTDVNKANYANYILQLTGHINELFDKISKTTINMVGRTMTPQFNSGTQNEIYLYRFNYMTRNMPVSSLQFNADTTELSLLPDKGWTNNYVKNWFIDDVSSHQLVYTFAIIQILLADIIHFIDTKYKMPLLDSAVGDAAKLLEIIFGHAATSAGISGPPGGGLPTAANVFKRVDPKFTKRIEFLRMALPRTGKEGDYWVNLDKMTKLIKKFSSQDYVDYSGILFRIYDNMQNIRKFEDKILEIKFKEDKTPKLPEVDLIAKNLETKPPASSKDAYTAAGQKLYDLLKDNKAYIAQNAFVVNTETLVRDLEPFLRQITKISNNNLIMDLELNNFFYTSPGDQFVDVLCTRRGAEKFVEQMKKSEYYKDDATISKICFSVMRLLGITPAKYKDAYDFYNPLTERNKNQLLAKKGNRKPGRHGHRRKHGGRRG